MLLTVVLVGVLFQAQAAPVSPAASPAPGPATSPATSPAPGFELPVLDVPFVPQAKDTCGAAALAMVMRYWGAEASAEEIAGELLDRELRGIAGSRLAGLARQRGFLAFTYAGDLAHLEQYLARGRPLVVAWKVGKDRYHDVVVVGVGKESVLVNDPAEGARRAVERGEFERRWAGSGHWTLLVLPEAR